jgi:hypothetical protein
VTSFQTTAVFGNEYGVDHVPLEGSRKASWHVPRLPVRADQGVKGEDHGCPSFYLRVHPALLGVSTPHLIAGSQDTSSSRVQSASSLMMSSTAPGMRAATACPRFNINKADLEFKIDFSLLYYLFSFTSTYILSIISTLFQPQIYNSSPCQ